MTQKNKNEGISIQNFNFSFCPKVDEKVLLGLLKSDQVQPLLKKILANVLPPVQKGEEKKDPEPVKKKTEEKHHCTDDFDQAEKAQKEKKKAARVDDGISENVITAIKNMIRSGNSFAIIRLEFANLALSERFLQTLADEVHKEKGQKIETDGTFVRKDQTPPQPQPEKTGFDKQEVLKLKKAGFTNKWIIEHDPSWDLATLDALEEFPSLETPPQKGGKVNPTKEQVEYLESIGVDISNARGKKKVGERMIIVQKDSVQIKRDGSEGQDKKDEKDGSNKKLEKPAFDATQFAQPSEVETLSKKGQNGYLSDRLSEKPEKPDREKLAKQLQGYYRLSDAQMRTIKRLATVKANKKLERATKKAKTSKAAKKVTKPKKKASEEKEVKKQEQKKKTPKKETSKKKTPAQKPPTKKETGKKKVGKNKP